MRAWVHFMQDTVKERLSLHWHDWVNPMWWHPPPPLWGCVSLQWIHLCLPFFAQVPEVILLHMGKALLPLIFTLDIIHTPRGGVYIYIFFFSPSKQTLGRLVWAEAYFFNQGACSLPICLIMSQPFSLLSLAGAQHGSPPSICCFVQPCRNNRFIKGQFDWKHKESFGSLSCASGYQDL